MCATGSPARAPLWNFTYHFIEPGIITYGAVSTITGAVGLDLPDPAVASIVAGWPQDFDTARAIALGFTAEKTFQEIIQVYLEDEMGQPALTGAAS